MLWDYCILSKKDVEQSSEELDEGDLMQLDIFEALALFYDVTKNFQLLKKMKSWICSSISLEGICCG